MVTHLVKLSRVPLCFIRMVQSDVGDGRSLYGITCNIFINGSCFALLTTVSRLFNNNTISTINTTTLNKFPRASVHPGIRSLELQSNMFSPNIHGTLKFPMGFSDTHHPQPFPKDTLSVAVHTSHHNLQSIAVDYVYLGNSNETTYENNSHHQKIMPSQVFNKRVNIAQSRHTVLESHVHDDAAKRCNVSLCMKALIQRGEMYSKHSKGAVAVELSRKL